MHVVSAISRALLLLALSAPFAAETRAEVPHQLRLSYEAWAGGLNSVGFNARLRRTATTYGIAVTAQTQGLVGKFYRYSLRLEATGRVGPNGLTPRQFKTVYGKEGDEKRREIRYFENGALEMTKDGQKEPIDQRGLSEAIVRGSMDPASAVLSVVEVFARLNRCAGTFPVFDGKRRYDLKLKEQGRRTLRPSKYGLYSGPAAKCRMLVEPQAGFRKRESRDGRFPRQIDVWLAAAAKDTHPVPVRIESHHNIGALVIHLVGVEKIVTTKHAQR